MDNRIPLVFLARHGTTTLNTQNLFRGPANPPLDKSGYQDAHRLAYWFDGMDLSAIFCSDKIRAHDTAKIVCENHELDPVAIPHLHAWNLGYLAGQKKSEHEDDVKYFQDNPDEPVPEGESLNDFKRRVRPIFKQAVEIAVNQGEPVLLITHSSVIHEAGAAVNGDHNSTVVRPGGVACIYRDGNTLVAEPIFKPDLGRDKSRGLT